MVPRQAVQQACVRVDAVPEDEARPAAPPIGQTQQSPLGQGAGAPRQVGHIYSYRGLPSLFKN